VRFALDEVVAARDAARQLGTLMSRLRDGENERFVIFYRNRPRAVLLDIVEYERLLASESSELEAA
jgi:hypothetical protein